MRDFTFQAFKSLCAAFQRQAYRFITFADYCLNNRPERFVIMRHDVDKMPEQALRIAYHENELGIKASFYFRIIKGKSDESVCKRISAMGHEIGYHYEDLSMTKGDLKKAIESFNEHLSVLRQLCPVKTICMHGSPLSKWDNRLMWQKYNYRDFGIFGEPYFDINFDEIFYLTDTGRCWNGSDVNIRDKVRSKHHFDLKSTFDIIEALNDNKLPDKIMINIHPHRWNDQLLPWFKELVWQNVKNVGKYAFVRLNK